MERNILISISPGEFDICILPPAEVPDEDRLLMREGGEGVSPVVAPHPAGSNSWTEGQD